MWRKGDNWTAFISGNMTWINGQSRVRSRVNTERFSWENTPVGAKAPRPVVKAAPRQPAVAPAALVQGSGSNAAGAVAPARAAAPTQAPAPPAAATQVPAPSAPAPSPAGTSKDACLGCHGLFDKLVSATSTYVWPKGGKENPHQYLPHGSQTVPDCSSCHTPHPVPPTAAGIAAMGKTSPKLCVGCHPGGF